jgi:uracil-DNA glycosylase family 4
MTPDQEAMWQAMGLGPTFHLKHAAHTPENQVEPTWESLRNEVAECKQCGLCESRTQTVFGIGPTSAPIMVIGEGPGADEDAQGEPFVGQAGKLLDQMLEAIACSRQSNVYIANVLKCRPPGNRNPEPIEVAKCSPFLIQQIELLQPKILFLLGKFAIGTVLKSDATVSSLRGKVHEVSIGQWRGPAVVSYHPAYLLRNLPEKAKSWEDLCLLKSLMA